MKKSAKPLIFFSLFVFVAYTLLTLIYVGVGLECEKSTKEKILTNEKLSDLKNWRINLVAQDQALSSEERIVDIAVNDLGMIKRTEPPIILKVNKDKIESISKIIDKKYE
ncbi:MAG: hypothetical protein M1480_01210 [Bacteroidetes bacterium]|nr:hypothetical protein [Bacteroidota bacterium]